MSLALLGVGAGGAAGYDADAQAFFTAYTITDNTQKSAVNQLVLDLKSAGLWTNMVGLYPIVGGDAAKHAGNLRSPGTYDLTFNGTFVHSSTGALPNGTDAYANTGLDGGFNPLQTLSFYSRTAGATLGVQMGVNNFGNTTRLLANYFGSAYYVITNTGLGTAAAGMTGSGLLTITRVDSSTNEVYENGSLHASDSTGTQGSLFSNPIYFFATDNSGGPIFFDTREGAFLSAYSGGMSSTEVTDLYNAVQAYETTLSRQV